MEIINKNITGNKPDIGRIDLLPDHTYFDVRKGDAHRVISALKNVDFFGTKLKPQKVSEMPADSGKREKGKEKKGKDERGKKEKGKGKGKKPDYNGNYEVFYKKKK